MLTISDLDHLEFAGETSRIAGGATTAAFATASASGFTSYAATKTISRTRQLPRGGSISISLGRAFGFATDPVDANASASVDVDAEGEITLEKTRSRNIDSGQKAIGMAFGIAVAITPPG